MNIISWPCARHYCWGELVICVAPVIQPSAFPWLNWQFSCAYFTDKEVGELEFRQLVQVTQLVRAGASTNIRV